MAKEGRKVDGGRPNTVGMKMLLWGLWLGGRGEGAVGVVVVVVVVVVVREGRWCGGGRV